MLIASCFQTGIHLKNNALTKKQRHCHLTRIFHESPAVTTDTATLPGVLGCRSLRRTVQVRLGINTLCLPSGTTIFMVATGDSWNIRDRLHAAILDYLPLSGFFNPISRKNICNFNCRSASVHLKSLPLYKVYKTCFPTLAGRFLLVW